MIALTIAGLFLAAATTTHIARINWDNPMLGDTGTAVLVGLAVTLWITTMAASLLALAPLLG